MAKLIPYYADDLVPLYHGDALELAATSSRTRPSGAWPRSTLRRATTFTPANVCASTSLAGPG